MEQWKGEFGDAYTERNLDTVNYVGRYGISRQKMFKQVFDGRILLNSRILEVGCNVGNQLAVLRDMGYKFLKGIDINESAVKLARSRGLDVSVGDATKIDEYDDAFDLVFTSGVLIHLDLETLKKSMGEIHRVSRRYVAGFEYYSDVPVPIAYRDNVWLWKRDFATDYVHAFGCKVDLMTKILYKYLDGSGNVDCGFLISKVKS